MKAQAWKCTQINAGGKFPAQKTTGMFQPFQDLFAAGGTFNARYKNIGVSQFAIHGHVCDIDLGEARVTDLLDQHFGEYFADAVGYTL